MMRFIIASAVVLGGFAQEAHALCTPGDERACVLNHQNGTQTCGPDGRFGPCILPDPPPPPPPLSGTVQPKYKIVTVIYAPPGRNGGNSTSAVAYGSGSSTGSTTSISHGIKSAFSVTAQEEAKLFVDITATESYSSTRNAVDTSAIDLKKSSSTTLSQGGPGVDGIDHDRDEIWLWLQPTLDVVLPTDTSIQWTFDNSARMDLQFVFVGWFKNPALMPAGLKTKLDTAGLTTDDYAQILTADPFANGDTTIDPNRFVSLNTTFPYEPPFGPNDPSPTLNFTATHQVTNTVTTSTTHDTSLGFTLSGGVDFTTVFSAKLTVGNTWTWTDENSRADAIGSTESASVTIGGPAFGYNGPTDVGVYYDVIYKTFAFAFAFVETLPVQGVVFSKSNAPVGGEEVVVDVGGVTYRTFTNPFGEFRLFGPRPGAMQLRVAGGAQVPVSLSRDPVVITVP